MDRFVLSYILQSKICGDEMKSVDAIKGLTNKLPQNAISNA